jgi:hypothetical protein
VASRRGFGWCFPSWGSRVLNVLKWLRENHCPWIKLKCEECAYDC